MVCVLVHKNSSKTERVSSNISLNSSYSFEFPEVFYILSIFIVFTPYVLLVCLVLRLRVNKICFTEKVAQDKSKKLPEA